MNLTSMLDLQAVGANGSGNHRQAMAQVAQDFGYDTATPSGQNGTTHQHPDGHVIEHSGKSNFWVHRPKDGKPAFGHGTGTLRKRLQLVHGDQQPAPVPAPTPQAVA